MLWTVFVILLLLWLLGLVWRAAFGGYVNLILVGAVIVLLIQLVESRRVI
jgi:hypothetical protein